MAHIQLITVVYVQLYGWYKLVSGNPDRRPNDIKQIKIWRQK